MIFLFSESDIGYHSKSVIDCEIIPLVFIPKIIKKNNDFFPYADLKNNTDLLDAIARGKTFLIGFDLDENGELMAHSLKNFLIEKGIKQEDIIRTPLTEDGYIATNSFLDISGYAKFRYYQEEFLKELRRAKLPRMTIMDLLALKYLNEKKGKDMVLSNYKKINFNGTSTVTFITNNLLKEGL